MPYKSLAQTRQFPARHTSSFAAQAAISTVESAPQTQAQKLLSRSDDVQRLQQYDPFHSLPASHALALVQRAERITLHSGEDVSVAGHPASALLIVRDGELHAEDATYQGPFCSIDGMVGLREVLLGTNFTQTVRAATDVELWRISKADLDAVVAQYPDVGLHLYAAATKQLTALTEELQDDIQQREALRAYSVTSPKVGIIGSSRYAKRLRSQIVKASQDPARQHVLIFGEPGLEKDTIASLIHFGSPARREAMVRLDCARPDGGLAELFGRGKKKGLLHWLENGTLLLTNWHQAPASAQKRLIGLMTDGGYQRLPAHSRGRVTEAATSRDPAKVDAQDAKPLQCRARIIVTTQQAVQFPDACRTLQIKVAPLRVRATDVAELQRYFLKQAARRRGVPSLMLTPAAVRQLQSYNYPNNIKELESMVERAATQAADFGPEIPDSVFWFATKIQDRLRSNLFKGLPELKQILRTDWWPEKINHGFTVWIYPAYVALLLWGPQDPTRNFGISLFWNYWWPVIFFVYPFLGRVWCAVCPFMIYGEVVQRWRLAQGAVLRKWPRQLSQEWGPWFLFTLFAAILVWEEVWDLPHTPYLSAWLLLIITAGAMICSSIFERRLWCRYLCPIGGMNGLFAKLSVTELRAKQGICHSNCATFHCYKGGPAEPPEGLETNGCPLHSHPAQLTDNADCVLCMECLKACPHGSVEFRLRPPGIDLWTSHTPSAAELALQFMLLGAVFVHHLPAVSQQVGLDPANLEGQLPHSLASFVLLSLPALLALGAHGVTHYLIRVTHHLTASAANQTRASDGSEVSTGDPVRLGVSRIQQQASAVAAAAAQVAADMARESAHSVWTAAAGASGQLLNSIQIPTTLLPFSQQVSPTAAASSRGPTKRGIATPLQDRASGLDAAGPNPSPGPSGLERPGMGSTLGPSGVEVAELQSRQKVPTAVVGVAVGRSRPPQAFLQLAYGYLPLVWAGTLTHYLPAFLLQAGRILPVVSRTVYADHWSPLQPESLPEFAANPAVAAFLQAACLAFGTAASLALLRRLGGRPWLDIAPHCLLTLGFAAELWVLCS
ncbi:hypothetical protein WJX74_006102 [Apatococcus lobatus]|uniref:4Fe-4S binding protein n=1 Tax=Apatococcus lobatus TaxID=904363 RepID=A0AAW1S3J0_9CHLO